MPNEQPERAVVVIDQSAERELRQRLTALAREWMNDARHSSGTKASAAYQHANELLAVLATEAPVQERRS